MFILYLTDLIQIEPVLLTLKWCICPSDFPDYGLDSLTIVWGNPKIYVRGNLDGIGEVFKNNPAS